jgi:hypothetical protein
MLRLVFAFVSLLAFAPRASAQWNYAQEAEFDSQALFGGNCGLGHAVALDGDTAVVGVPHPGAGGQSGRVVVYRRTSGVWALEANLAPLDGAPGNYCGWSVALQGDTLVAGAIYADVGAQSGVGAAYVFRRTGTTWTQEQKLVASDPLQGAEFGYSVGISGSTIVVGAPQATYASQGGRGAAYIFEFDGLAWSQTQKLAGSGTTFGARNGSSVAIDGARLVIGARTTWEDAGATIGTGSGWVFVKSGASWVEQQKLQSTSYVAWALLGASCAIDGNRIVLGAEGEESNKGAAYVFDLVGGTWQQKARLTGANTDASDFFGRGVAVSGNRIVVGAPNYDSSTPQGNGVVKLFDFDGATWTERVELLGNPMYVGDTLGDACAIQGDLVVGGSPSLAFGQLGRVWMWNIDPPVTTTYCTAKTTSNGCVPAIAASGVPSVSSALPFTVSASSVINQKQGLCFYGFHPAAAPFQGGYLCVTPPTQRTATQNSGGSPAGLDCSGTFALDFNATIQSGVDPLLTIGADVYFQYWFRDPQSPSTTGLSNGLRAFVQS